MPFRIHTPLLLLLVCGLGAAACLDEGLLDGKLCDEQGACLPGYACDPDTGRCVPEQDLPDAGDGGDGDLDGDGPMADGVSNLGPEGLAWLCASDQVVRLTGDGSLDTGTGQFQTPQGTIEPTWFRVIEQPDEGLPALAVVSLDSFHIQPNATLRVTGDNALVVLTCQEVDIKGSLDASGQAGQMQPDAIGIPGQDGPGGFAGGDQNGGQGMGPGGGGGGGEADCHELVDSGGAGGGFHAPGGAGGDGRWNDCDRHGPEGGSAVGDATLTPLLGGSGGGGGGDGSGGPGGGGGGAIQLVSAGQIVIEVGGLVRVAGGGGAGGHDGLDSSAGGGGGAGGAILLEAPAVIVRGALAANGGGGGAGYGDNLEWADQVAPSGFDGGSDATPAPGGAGAGLGGSGGPGGAGAHADGQPGQTAQNAGGGGGAAGRIRINSASGQATFESGALISPSEDPGGCSGGCTQGPLP